MLHPARARHAARIYLIALLLMALAAAPHGVAMLSDRDGGEPVPYLTIDLPAEPDSLAPR